MLDLLLPQAVKAAGRRHAGPNREGSVPLAHTTAGARSSRSRRGAILVGVLWILVFLGFLAVVLRVHIGSVVASVRVTEDKAAARIIAEAALARAAGRVLAAPFTPDASVGDQMQDAVETASGKVAVALTNEAWRIDLNTAERPLIIGALLAAGAEPGLAETLADRIVARRGSKTQVPPAPELANGQENPPITEAPAPDADPMQTVSEVALIEGMPEDVALGLAAYTTVASGLKGVRLVELSDRVLRQIPGLESSLVGAIERYRRGELLREQLDPLLASAESNSSEQTATWRALLTVDLKTGHTETHEALIMISPDDNAPYRIVDWRRVTSGAE